MLGTKILFMIHDIAQAYTKICEPIHKKYSIQPTAFDILMFIANNENETTARDITEIRGIKPNLVSFHVDKLVQNDYLIREKDTKDRRKVILKLTDKTDEIIKDGREIQKVFNDLLLQDINEDELKVLVEFYTKLSNNAKKI